MYESRSHAIRAMRQAGGQRFDENPDWVQNTIGGLSPVARKANRFIGFIPNTRDFDSFHAKAYRAGARLHWSDKLEAVA